MKDADIVRIAGWVVRRGLAGVAEEDLLREFCEKCRAAGLELSRALAFIDTLHPVHEGRVFRWRDDASNDAAMVEYGRSDQGEAAETGSAARSSISCRPARRNCAGASASAKPPISRSSRR